MKKSSQHHCLELFPRSRRHEDSEQLFDLRNNPEENVNLVKRPEHRELAASLKARALEGWRLDRYQKRKKARKKGA